jgi:DNA-binding PadR family transcriptional regulator
VLTDIKSSLGISLGIGTLYQAIDRMVGEGLIEPLPSADRRRPYHLTLEGEAELRKRLDLMQQMAAVGRSRLVDA